MYVIIRAFSNWGVTRHAYVRVLGRGGRGGPGKRGGRGGGRSSLHRVGRHALRADTPVRHEALHASFTAFGQRLFLPTYKFAKFLHVT